MDYQEIRQSFLYGFDPGDSWACVMGAWFDVADEIERQGGGHPDAWRYRPGACGPPELNEDEATWFALEIAGADLDALAAFGNVLERWSRMLRHAGRDY